MDESKLIRSHCCNINDSMCFVWIGRQLPSIHQYSYTSYRNRKCLNINVQRRKQRLGCKCNICSYWVRNYMFGFYAHLRSQFSPLLHSSTRKRISHRFSGRNLWRPKYPGCHFKLEQNSVPPLNGHFNFNCFTVQIPRLTLTYKWLSFIYRYPMFFHALYNIPILYSNTKVREFILLKYPSSYII